MKTGRIGKTKRNTSRQKSREQSEKEAASDPEAKPIKLTAATVRRLVDRELGIDRAAEAREAQQWCQKAERQEEQRRFHQEASQPTMAQLHDWLRRQLDENLTEPNSALGGAIGYMLRHWEKLTLFLRQAGAPLDNNACERALKKAILHRKNALFYKTQNGARVGDLFMSLIYTCQLNENNPFDYLTQLQPHAGQVAASPEVWMPWNYRAALT
jgi:hypothetical protein